MQEKMRKTIKTKNENKIPNPGPGVTSSKLTSTLMGPLDGWMRVALPYIKQPEPQVQMQSILPAYVEQVAILVKKYRMTQ